MKKIIGCILCFALAFVSCNKNKNIHITETNKIKTEEKHHSETGVLELNDGKKWQANPETIEGILNMQGIVNNFLENNGTDYHQIKIQLEEEFTAIFKKCIMTGKAHDQLHNFLFPMKEYFEIFGADNAEKSHLALLKYSKHLTIFFDYFKE